MSKDQLKKILIIDDDPLISKIIELGISKGEGLDVIVSADANEGFRRALEEKPDLILLDIFLTKKSGFDVLAELKSEPKTRNIPVIISSVVGDEEYIEKGLALGAEAYVVKGKISLDDLRARLKETISLQ